MSKCQSEAENGTAAEKKSRNKKKKSQLYVSLEKRNLKKIPRPTEGRPGVYYGVWSVTGAVSLLHFRLIELTES